MSNVVDLMLGEELRRHDPGTIGNDLINPLAVTDSFRTLGTAENSQAFSHVCLFVAGDADNQIRVREGLLGLFQLSHVSAGREKALAMLCKGQLFTAPSSSSKLHITETSPALK